MIRFLKYLTVIFICFFFSSLPVLGFDIDKYFPQVVKAQHLKELIDDKKKCLSIFLENPEFPDRPIVLNFMASADEKYFVLRGKLTPEQTKLLKKPILKGRTTKFKGFRIDGSVFYEQGNAKVGRIKIETSEIKFVFVPYNYAGASNKGFTSDLGYIQFKIPTQYLIAKANLKFLISQLFQPKTELCEKVKKNRYFLLRDSYYGLVNYFAKDPTKKYYYQSIFPPIHKLTLNKGITNWKDKTLKDSNLIAKILLEDEFLFSQDERTKRGWVPDFVKIDPKRLSQTDIGSGQNHVVFLTIGPGINYFDDPWRKVRLNVPCPRLIFSKLLYDIEQAQYYPSFSIDPIEDGNGRLMAINRFQKPATTKEGYRSLQWMDNNRKQLYFKAIDQELCNYGLTNDSPDLEQGFDFMGVQFRGNIVNNEVRIYQAVGVKESLQGIIIPHGSRNTYLKAIKGHMHDLIFMKKFEDLLIEAPFSTDKGFRIAYLAFLLKSSHPQYYRLYQLAFNRKQALCKIMDHISAQVKKEGPAFFTTNYYIEQSEEDNKQLERWLEYLEALRENNPNLADRKLLSCYKSTETSKK